MSDSKGAFSVRDRPHARTQTRTRHGNASLAHPAPPEEPPGGRDRGHTHTIPLTALPRVSRGGAKGAPQGTTCISTSAQVKPLPRRRIVAHRGPADTSVRSHAATRPEKRGARLH